LLEGFLESLRRGDAAVVVALAAFEIAHTIERLQDLLAEFRRFAEDRLAHVGGSIGEAGKIVVAVDLEHVVEQEAHIFHGGFVDWHRVLSAKGGLCGKIPASQQSRSRRRPYLVPGIRDSRAVSLMRR
jgi:hypothetical protein